jgi:hypothetical protein
MRCRIAAATRVASLNVTAHRGLPKRKRRTHPALVKDLDEFVSSRSCCLISICFHGINRNTRLAVFIGAAGWRVTRVRSPRKNLIRRDLCCPHFDLSTSETFWPIDLRDFTDFSGGAGNCPFKRSAVADLHSVWRPRFLSAATNRVSFEKWRLP